MAKTKDLPHYDKIAFVLSCIALVAWIFPIVGYPVSLAGFIFGTKALGSGNDHTRSSLAIIICVLSFAATVGSSYYGYHNAQLAREASIQNQQEEQRLNSLLQKLTAKKQLEDCLKGVNDWWTASSSAFAYSDTAMKIGFDEKHRREDRCYQQYGN